jgi:RNA-directed DNA polymerase
LKDSWNARKMQTTSKEGYPEEVGMEFRGNLEARSDSVASTSRGNEETKDYDGLLEKILDRNNLNQAYKKVKGNGGSHGVDGMKVDELLAFLKQNGEFIRQSILTGDYIPKPVRRVEIPKPDKGVRLLGIPTVLDRMIQQAIAQVITPIFEAIFSPNSYGFRPGRSPKQAIEAAREYIQEGYTWVVDIDLEKFFDRVNHDKLMALISQKISDKRVLKLIRKYLESGVMINGLEIVTEEGTPQGGPLSPLLSNIMLNELDKELESRGHKFCRFADDCNIYVKSRKAGERVMASITKFIEGRLKLKINRGKSAVDRPWKRKFLGFSFYLKKDGVGIRVHEKSIKRFKAEVREMTSKSDGSNIASKIMKLRQKITGWVNYFGIADMKGLATTLDEWIRRRLRMCYWKQWKKVKTKFDKLVKLGTDVHKAWEFANTRKGYWRISNSPILNRTITNELFEKLGYQSILKRYLLVH